MRATGARPSSVDLTLPSPPDRLRGPTQIARAVTEGWAARTLPCFTCGGDRLDPVVANAEVADLRCPACAAEYELKSKKGRFARTVANGAYAAKVRRLASGTSPHLLLLGTDAERAAVRSLVVIPGRFFSLSVIRKRPALKSNARRAGWVGSTIRLDLIPQSGRIDVVREGLVSDPSEIDRAWRRTAFIDRIAPESRGWLNDVLACVEEIAHDPFTLDDVYAFAPRLQALHPDNRNVRPKIRQQLQVLRDNGQIAFLGGGTYSRTG